MRSRTAGFLFFVSIVLGATATATSGCSSDATKAAAADSGADAPGANRPAPAGDNDASDPSTCRDRCAAAHPAAVLEDKAIDTCWRKYCQAPCIDETPDIGDAGAVVGDGGDGGNASPGADAGTCKSNLVTDTASCDQCTGTFCCTAWDGCFQDPECSALEACYQQCVGP